MILHYAVCIFVILTILYCLLILLIFIHGITRLPSKKVILLPFSCLFKLYLRHESSPCGAAVFAKRFVKNFDILLSTLFTALRQFWLVFLNADVSRRHFKTGFQVLCSVFPPVSLFAPFPLPPHSFFFSLLSSQLSRRTRAETLAMQASTLPTRRFRAIELC